MSEPLEASLVRARRATASGRALFREGLVPECHAYLALALRELCNAWAPAEPGSGEASDPARHAEDALTALSRAGYRDIERLRAALLACANVGPELPVVAAERRDDFDPIWVEVERLTRFTVRHFDAKDRKKRARRLARRGLVLAIVLVAVLVAHRWKSGPTAYASASISEEHTSAEAIDGLEGTEWLLPDQTVGWIDVSLPASQAIHSVRLLNAHNVYYADRASHEVRVTAFSGDKAVGSAEGAFAKLTRDRSVLDLPLEAKRVSRLRVEVISFFNRGGGFAEIEIR